jgi:hypothetical protein
MFLSQFGASDPSLGHPAPDRLVLVVVGEFGHAFTVSSVSQEFLRKDHPDTPKVIVAEIYRITLLFSRELSDRQDCCPG